MATEALYLQKQLSSKKGLHPAMRMQNHMVEDIMKESTKNSTHNQEWDSECL